jgi:hypothetical protein
VGYIRSVSSVVRQKMFYVVSIAVTLTSLGSAVFIYKRYVIDPHYPGCIAFPAQFIMTVIGMFSGSAIPLGDWDTLFGWRLFASVMIGIGSCLGMLRSRQIVHRG